MGWNGMGWHGMGVIGGMGWYGLLGTRDGTGEADGGWVGRVGVGKDEEWDGMGWDESGGKDGK